MAGCSQSGERRFGTVPPWRSISRARCYGTRTIRSPAPRLPGCRRACSQRVRGGMCAGSVSTPRVGYWDSPTTGSCRTKSSRPPISIRYRSTPPIVATSRQSLPPHRASRCLPGAARRRRAFAWPLLLARGAAFARVPPSNSRAAPCTQRDRLADGGAAGVPSHPANGFRAALLAKLVE